MTVGYNNQRALRRVFIEYGIVPYYLAGYANNPNPPYILDINAQGLEVWMQRQEKAGG